MEASGDTEQRHIVARMQRGDASAAEHLYRCNARYLAGVCTRYITAPDDVHDVLHDSFLKIFASIGSLEYQGDHALRGWMARIVVNESLKFLKKRCRFDTVPLDESPAIGMADAEPDVDAVAAEVLHAMIRELPEGCRTVLNLFVFEEKSHKEIARELNIGESTSASQFHRAKHLLAKKINQYLNTQSIRPA